MDFRSELYFEYIDSNGVGVINPLPYAFSKYLDLFPASSLSLYKVIGATSGNLEFISQYLYSTPDYFWLLALLNGIDNVLLALPVNSFIYYPPEQLINSYKSELAEIVSLSSNNNNIYLGGAASTPIM